MRRLLLACLVVVALVPAVAVYSVSALGAPAADGKLFATVGPSLSISLTNAAGAPVTRLDPGTYEIEIDDRSAAHSFRLTGPGGVNAGTEVDFVGIRTVTVTLGNGDFTFFCEVHPYDMLGQFQVGTGGGTPPPPPTASGPRLVATVGPGQTISLTKNGVNVAKLKPKLKAGPYSITVRDRSALHSFHLKGPGSVNKKTGIVYVGKKPWIVWNVRLRAGTYSFWCDSHPVDMRGSFGVRKAG